MRASSLKRWILPAFCLSISALPVSAQAAIVGAQAGINWTTQEPAPTTPPVEQPLMGQTNAPANGRLSGQTGDLRQGTEHPGLPYFIWPPELLRLLGF